MKKFLVGTLSVVLTVVPCLRASAYGHANYYGGGSTYHSGDTTTRTNAYGGEATHTAGEGTTASNSYGASASHAEGSGTTTATNAYGGSATHYAGDFERLRRHRISRRGLRNDHGHQRLWTERNAL
jgi:hypothetical protein